MCSTAIQSQRLCSMQGLGATELVRPAFRPAPSQPTHTHTRRATNELQSAHVFGIPFKTSPPSEKSPYPRSSRTTASLSLSMFPERHTETWFQTRGHVYSPVAPTSLSENGWVLSPRWGSTVTSWPRILTRGSTCTKTLNSFCRNPPFQFTDAFLQLETLQVTRSNKKQM